MLAANQLNSNRLGFRGIEDLGSGLKAGFWLEAGMDNGTGFAGGGSGNVAAGDSTGANQGQLFNRRSTVSLIHDKFGEVRLGRDYDPSFWNTVYDDVNGANGLGQGLNLISSLGSGATTVARANNSIGYFLPGGIGGIYGQAMYALGQTPSGQGNKYWGGRIGWGAGPIDVNGILRRDPYRESRQLHDVERWRFLGLRRGQDLCLLQREQVERPEERGLRDQRFSADRPARTARRLRSRGREGQSQYSSCLHAYVS